MLVAQILKAKGSAVHTADPKDTIAQAATLLLTRRVGAVVLVQGEEMVCGILSERDIVAAIARDGEAALSKPVSAYMTREVLFATPHEDVDSLLSRMTDRRMRHLPVLVDGRLVGIVSIGDLVKSKISEVETEARGLKAYITAG
ncbi:MAG: inosine-5-monophosphate dehydrogenase [Caulobacteraceae bacterium]|nr:inosine-5-monophosphate dehydrogenase [Caulobacteraceae bacterium]